MNYIEQINGFWAKAENCDLTGNDIAVYMALLKYCNSLNWLNPFVCHWYIVCQYAKVSKNTYYKSIEKLSNKGYITHLKGQRNKLASKIVILKFENNKGIIREQKGNKEGTEREQTGNLYKLLNKETIKLLNNNYSVVNQNLKTWLENNQVRKLKDIDSRKADFKKSLHPFLDQYDKDLLNAFYSYWTEHGEKDRKMRFEKQKSFGISRRLATWKKNESNFNNKKNKNGITRDEQNKQAREDLLKGLADDLFKESTLE